MNQIHSMKAKHTEPAKYEPALTAHELSMKISALGIKKANTEGWQLFLLALLSGLYISIGALLFLVALEQGMGRIVGGLRHVGAEWIACALSSAVQRA